MSDKCAKCERLKAELRERAEVLEEITNRYSDIVYQVLLNRNEHAEILKQYGVIKKSELKK